MLQNVGELERLVSGAAEHLVAEAGEFSKKVEEEREKFAKEA